MTWIFGSFLVTPLALTSCHVVICKQVKAVGSNRCVTGGDHVMRTARADLDRMQRIRVDPGKCSRSEASRLARGCKRWHPQAPGRRYGTRRSPLSEYMSLHLSIKCGSLSSIK